MHVAVNIDLTPPKLTVAPKLSRTPAGLQMSITGVAQDALSGLYPARGSYVVIDGAGAVAATGAVPFAADRSYSVQFVMPAPAPADYTVTVYAADKAGNPA